MRKLFIVSVLFMAPATQALPLYLPPPAAYFECGENFSPLVRVAAAQNSVSGPIDNPLVATQAPWIKASLLLNFKNSLNRPRLPAVQTSTASESELQKQSEAVENILKLRQGQKQVLLTVQDRQKQVATTTAQIQTSTNGQREMHQKVLDLIRQVDELRHGSWFCGMGILCGADVKDAQKNLDGAKSSEAHFASDRAQEETKLNADNLKLGLATKDFIDETQKLKMAGVNTTVEQDLQPGSIDRELERLQIEMQTVSTFIPIERDHRLGSVKHCARPMRYHLSQNLNEGLSKNPLTEDKVAPELEPDASAVLEVCVNRADQVQSIHILQNDTEILSSVITANAHGEVTRIKVLNAEGHLLEERDWLNLPNGKIRFKASYYPTDDLSGKPVSAIQDQSPEREK